jgi:hypothetical protein
MPNFESLKMPPRILICGEPASGKTGALAQLANAGYRLLIHDFDQNSRIIDDYLKPGHAPVYINTYTAAKQSAVSLFDTGAASSAKAMAEAKRFAQCLMHWKTDSEDLGPCTSWTGKDVVVIDSGTFLGDLLLAAAPSDKTAMNDKRSYYQIAGAYYGDVLDRLTGINMGASVILLTHLMQTGEKDDQGRIIGKTRDIPVGIGEKFSKKMQTYFSDIWHLEVDRAGNRVFKTAATDKASLRTSAPNLIKASEPYDLASMMNRLVKVADQKNL